MFPTQADVSSAILLPAGYAPMKPDVGCCKFYVIDFLRGIFHGALDKNWWHERSGGEPFLVHLKHAILCVFVASERSVLLLPSISFIAPGRSRYDIIGLTKPAAKSALSKTPRLTKLFLRHFTFALQLPPCQDVLCLLGYGTS